ncbi:MAG: hypothetical protein NXI31_19055 [bacterium]|nr:hypothetical protein [bacterium]
MSTTPENQPSEAPEGPQHEPLVDGQSGVYGWFRRNQKILLYTVGMFVLVFFSVSGPMLAWVDRTFSTPPDLPSITVGGQSVSLTQEDFTVGRQVAARRGAMSVVLPMIQVGQNPDADEVFAILRRVAIAEGFEISNLEVDRAINAWLEESESGSAAQLAGQAGFGSLAEFRQVVGEAQRIGMLIRLQTLALDNSDAAILEDVIGEREKITLKVASYDESARMAELKAAGGVTDEDLRTWLDGKDDTEKQRLDVFAPNQVALILAGVKHAEYDRSEWEASYLTDLVIGEEELEKLYQADREKFKQEDGTYKTLEDEGVADQLKAKREVNEILKQILAKVRERRTEFMSAEDDAFRTANEEFLAAQNEKVEVQQALDKDPENEQFKADLQDAENKLTQRENAKNTANEAREAKFSAFDFVAAFNELTKGENGPFKGVFVHDMGGLKTGDDLKDLEIEGLELGEWPQGHLATFLNKKGQLGFQPAFTEKGTFLYQAKDLLTKPLKSWEELKPLLEDAYFGEKAQTEAEEKKDKFEAALLRLAKTKMPDKVAEIEGKKQERIDEAMTKWESDLNDELAYAKKQRDEARAGTAARRAWEKKVTQLEALLTTKPQRLNITTDEIAKAIEEEIGEEAKKHHLAVLDEAAAEAGFTVAEFGPFPRDLSRRPRFDKKYDKTVVYLFRTNSELEKDESTGLLHDAGEKRYHCAVCTDVQPLEPADVMRAEFENRRKGLATYAAMQAYQAYGQAFTLEALEQRYALTRPVGEQGMPE